MKYPSGKTPAQMTEDMEEFGLKEHDVGYIDGYVHDHSSRPCAVFVRESDGMISLVPINYYMKAIVD